MKKGLLLAPMGSVHRRFNQSNIEALQEIGYEVHLIANFSNGPGTESQNKEFISQCHKEGIIIHSIPYQRRSLFKNLLCLSGTLKIIRHEGFDLIHAHTETGGLILRLLAMIGNIDCKLVYTPHGMSFYEGCSFIKRFVFQPIEKWICSIMNCCIGINEEEYNTFILWNSKSAHFVPGIGVNLERLHTISQTRENIRCKFKIPAKAIVLLSIGELDDNKNHKVVIKALGKHMRKDLYYIICGEGSSKGMLQNMIVQYGLTNNIILAGYRKDIPDIIGASDIFVFPSFHEGLSVALMEAMAGGLAIICSNIRGNKDLVINNKNGYLINPNDEEQIYDKIDLLSKNEQLRKYFTLINNVEIQRYSMLNVKNELLNIYKSNIEG